MRLLKIDGSSGEGGGQILRTALTLSTVTGRPFEMFNIRAGRKSPGLRPQHFWAVRAAEEVCGAVVEGVEVGSKSITFTPGGLRPGGYSFDIGTAGSVSLVLQAIFLPLALVNGASRDRSSVRITGGTHVPWSPCYHYLSLHWIKYMNMLGFSAGLQMTRAGFYPKGGGEIVAEITPAHEVRPMVLKERGLLKSISLVSLVGNLPGNIIRRQKERAKRRLADEGITCPLDIRTGDMPAVGQGTMLLLVAGFEHSQCCYYGLGAVGKRSEAVADEAVDGLLGFLKTGGVVDEHLADQLLLPLALSKGESEFITPRVTAHLTTNIEVIEKFLPVTIEVEDMGARGGTVRITRPRG